jgi:hypothetical protein
MNQQLKALSYIYRKFDVVSFRFGVAKYFNFSGEAKLGIETGFEYYPQEMKIDRCMTFGKGNIEPYVALQVKF